MLKLSLFVLFVVHVVALSAQSKEEYLSQGENFYAEKDYKNVIYAFSQAIESGDNSSKTYLLRGSSYLFSGDYAPLGSSQAVYSIQFWDDGTNSSGIIYGTSEGFNISSNDLVNQNELKATCTKFIFNSTIASIGSDTFTNIKINAYQ